MRTDLRAVFEVDAVAGVGAGSCAYTEGGFLFEGGKGGDLSFAGIAPERVYNEGCAQITPPYRAWSLESIELTRSAWIGGPGKPEQIS